jgi:hypothetical protein
VVVVSAGNGTEDVKHYGITYNCLREGGDRITLVGHNFGEAGARVTVNGRPCHSVVHDVPQTQVSCTAPAGALRRRRCCPLIHCHFYDLT